MNEYFKESLTDLFVELHIRLYHPRATRHRYKDGKDGMYERLEDKIKLDFLKEVLSLNKDWDIEELGREATEKIRKKTGLY